MADHYRLKVLDKVNMRQGEIPVAKPPHVYLDVIFLGVTEEVQGDMEDTWSETFLVFLNKETKKPELMMTSMILEMELVDGI